MAKRNSITKAQRDLTFILDPSDVVPTGTISYIDTAQSLSIVNRKLFSQEKCYGISDVQFYFAPSLIQTDPAEADYGRPINYDTLLVELGTMGDTWSVHNAWTKGKALFDEMNDLVLEDNPSIEAKWHDYKIFLDGAHRNNTVGAGAPGNLIPVAGQPTFLEYLQGEWSYSIYVMPQHEIDLATGDPKPADETFAHMLGPNLGAAGSFLSVGLVEAYQESRSTVFPDSPNVPAGMADSFFNLLTDSGSQEPELAQVINVTGDNPPYDLDNYPGSGLNAAVAVVSGFDMANSAQPNGRIEGFLSQCGLIQVKVQAFLNGSLVNTPAIQLKMTVAPGHYKGVAAIDMGQ